jgi:hypothetical protein
MKTTIDYEQIIDSLAHQANFNSRADTASKLNLLYHSPEVWNVRSIPGLSVAKFDSFKDFVLYRTPWGLGWTESVLKAFVEKEKPDLWKKIESETPELYGHGKNPKCQPKVAEVTCNLTTRGNTRTYKIAKLKRDAPEYAEKVIRGELSANRAMVEAGLELEKVTIHVDVNAFCNAIKRKFSPLEIQQLKDLL